MIHLELIELSESCVHKSIQLQILIVFDNLFLSLFKLKTERLKSAEE